jgi:hypothetical protein
MKFIVPSGILLGMILDRWINKYYGLTGSLAVATGAIMIGIIGLIILAFCKQYFVASVLTMIVFPVIIMLIGMYLSNIYLMIVGLILLFILGKVAIKVLQGYKNKK